MKKILFIDIDNTLKKYGQKVSKLNLLALKLYVKQKGTVVLCSGRSINTITKTKNQIEKAINKKIPYIVASNGAYILDTINNTVCENFINDKIGKEIFKISKKNHIFNLIASKESVDNKETYTSNYSFFYFGWKFFNHFSKIKKIKKDENKHIYKILLWSFSNKKINKTFNIIKSKYSKYLNISYTGNKTLEINKKNINKGYAVNYILNKLKLTKNDAFAIGDSGNDVAMFENVSYSFCINTKNLEALEKSNINIPFFKNAVHEIITKYIISK